MRGDPDDLERFVTAQDGVHDRALAELRRGHKDSHWMWFVFPQLRGLGQSAMSMHYGLSGPDEARRYLAHPVLGPRIIACAEAVLAHDGLSATDIFGPVDADKLRSSATLFAAVKGAPPVFAGIIATFFGGQPCPVTVVRIR